MLQYNTAVLRVLLCGTDNEIKQALEEHRQRIHEDWLQTLTQDFNNPYNKTKSDYQIELKGSVGWKGDANGRAEVVGFPP